MQTIGERLEEARKKKGVSIREAAEATKIRGDYLQKFESNQFDIGLTEIYTRGFLRTYASFLKIPTDRIMSDYAALGRGDVRPRQPNREIYGRMDISVTTSGETGERTGAEPEAPAAESGSRAQPHYPRGTGTSLPTGPDPAVMYKWMKIGGVALGVIVVVIILMSVFSGRGSSPTPARSTPAASTQQPTPSSPGLQAPSAPTITLVAVNPVNVRVQRKNADETPGETIFEGMLNRGDTRTIPWPGELYVTASVAENLQFEVNGRRSPMGQTGYATGRLPAPPKR